MSTSDSSTSTSTSTGNGSAGPSANDPDAIRADIERTREELAQTVDALQSRLDVKSRAKARLAQVKDQATTDSGGPRPELVAGAVGVVLLAAGLVWLRRR